MQFSTATVAAFVALASARGLPRAAEMLAADGSLFRRSTCDTAPTATSGSASPISTPDADTAAACQDKCKANPACQSFLFGTGADGDVECLLYNVPADQVPEQSGGGDLQVYDQTCTGVPTTVPSASRSDDGGEAASSSDDDNNNGGSSSRSRSRRAVAAEAKKPEAQQPAQQGGKAAGQTANKVQARDICGKAPTGGSNNNASPAQTLTSIDSAQACLTKGKSISGCKSVEFGKTSANGQNECLIFDVAASNLPKPASGASLVAYDVGC